MSSNRLDKVAKQYLQYLANRGRSKKTIRLYQDSLHMLCLHLSSIGIDTIDRVDKKSAVSFATKLSESNYKAITRGLILGQVKRFFRYCVESGYLLKNPFRSEQIPRVGRTITRNFLTIDEMQKFFNKVEDDTNEDIMYRTIYELLYGSGLRISEALSLTLNDIDISAGTIHIEESKNGTRRTIPIPELTVTFLALYKDDIRPEFISRITDQDIPKDHFFINGKGKMVRSLSVNRRLKKIATRAGIEKAVSCHSFRYSYATHMLEAGIDLRQLAELMGHKCIDTTANYTRVLVDKLRKELSRHPRGNLSKKEIGLIKYFGADDHEETL